MEEHFINPSFISAIGTVFACIYAFVKGWDVFKQVKESKYWKSIQATEAAAVAVHDEYVRRLEAAAADGVITEEERDEARRAAVERAEEIARAKGINLMKELSFDEVWSWIEKAFLDIRKRERDAGER